MSIINTMLRELDQRQPTGLATRYQPPVGGRLHKCMLAGLLVVILCAGSGFLAWQLIAGNAAPLSLSRKDVNDASNPEPVETAHARSPVVSAAVAVEPQRDSTVSQILPTSAAQLTAAMVSPVSGAADVAVPISATDKADATVAPQTPVSTAPVVAGATRGGGAEFSETVQPGNRASPGILDIAEEQLSPQEEAASARRKALQAMSRGQLSLARDEFTRALARDPLDHESRERLAGLLYGEGRLADARQLLSEGIKLVPLRADFRLMQARIALAMGNKAEALQSLTGLEPPVSDNMDYYATRAALAQELSQPALAARTYQSLTRVQPAEGRWWLGLAIANDRQGLRVQALDAYRRAAAVKLGSASRQFVQQRITQLEP